MIASTAVAKAPTLTLSRYLSNMVLVLMLACTNATSAATPQCAPQTFPGAVGATQVALCQNWDDTARQEFWFLPQGSQLLPYAWFLALEQADSRGLLSAPEYLDSFGYIPQRATGLNPDALPIGFTQDRARGNKAYQQISDSWLGFNCAACHTNRIDFGQHQMVIDGAPTTADFEGFLHAVQGAMEATLGDPEKFSRFVERLAAADQLDSEQRTSLRADLKQVTTIRAAWNERNRGHSPYGFARLDAIGAIFNEISVGAGGGVRAASAPVSYPFIWDTPQHDRVQWNGSVHNAGAGALGRNVGEVLGVFGSIKIQPVSLLESGGILGYRSSVRIANLGRLEARLVDLVSPRWADTELPQVDQSSDKFRLGKKLFADHCSECHHSIDRTDPKRCVEAVMTPVSELGTDPQMVNRFAEWQGPSAKLARRFKTYLPILGLTRFGREAKGIDMLGHAVIATTVRKAPASLIAIAKGKPHSSCRESASLESEVASLLDRGAGAVESVLSINRTGLTRDLTQSLAMRSAAQASLPADELAYKGRPLNGIWATAPYLHNGSVPTLRALLKAPADRPATFFVGSRRYDPVDVGFVHTEAQIPAAERARLFKFDTSLAGNANSGHVYPKDRRLTADEIDALVIYQKSL